MSAFDDKAMTGFGRIQSLMGTTVTLKLLGASPGTSIPAVWEPEQNELEQSDSREGRLRAGTLHASVADYATVTFRSDEVVVGGVSFMVIDGVVNNAGMHALKCEEFTTTEVRRTPRGRM